MKKRIIINWDPSIERVKHIAEISQIKLFEKSFLTSDYSCQGKIFLFGSFIHNRSPSQYGNIRNDLTLSRHNFNVSYEPPNKKTNNLLMRKQSCRSAMQ